MREAILFVFVTEGVSRVSEVLFSVGLAGGFAFCCWFSSDWRTAASRCRASSLTTRGLFF